MSKSVKVKLNCPAPVQEFDSITIGHGGGGKLTQNLLKSGVFSLLNNEWLREQGDAAVIQLNGKIAFSTDTFVVSPLLFPGGTIGDLAVNGTVNDLAVSGARPLYLSLSFILEEGLEMTLFYQILQSIRDACVEAGVEVVTGDTKVVEKGKGDQIFINTTGIGETHPKANMGMNRIKGSDAILLSGPVARHGITIMSKRNGLEFETKLNSDTRPLHRICLELMDKFGSKIHLMRDPTRGGVATVLNEIAEQTGLGINLIEKELPVEDEVAGACEMLGLDPLYVANEGLFVAIVDAEIADECLDLLQKWEHGSSAAIIGEVTEDHPNKVVLHSSIGGRRVLAQASGELLPRIC
ncbi:MAG: hydrogenase expression/formation protein HypE [Bacteroidetes bacterium]|jgi:hydrogenase expression/formation protein HypE|nr:hydrogenase expression/formation protein HypE [Bacteroidota bacterium]